MNVYTHGHDESVLRSHRWRTAENSAGYLLGHLRAGQSLLDVGSGPGTITLDLAARLAPGRVTALEATEQALALTRAEAERREDPDAVDYLLGDIHALAVPDKTYDVTHAHQVLQHLADPVQALREMARVTRPGGLVAARDSDYRAKAWFPRLPELDHWMALYQRCARANGGEPDAGRHLLAWARAAGLQEATLTAGTWCFATEEDRAWWGGMWADRILTSAMARQAVDSGFATREDLHAISAGWRRWAAAEDGCLILVHGQLLARV